jgi:arsenate reductase (thioredoxin)
MAMKRVLFVCVGNAGRSQMAEAFFNQMAKGKALALSAGTQPTDKVNPVVIEAMREIGIDISANKPKALTLEMIEKADRMITMGCGADAGGLCPASFVETEHWALLDPKGKIIDDVMKIRAEIKRRVSILLSEIVFKSEDSHARNEEDRCFI